jgi:hypothetical protein
MKHNSKKTGLIIAGCLLMLSARLVSGQAVQDVQNTPPPVIDVNNLPHHPAPLPDVNPADASKLNGPAAVLQDHVAPVPAIVNNAGSSIPVTNGNSGNSVTPVGKSNRDGTPVNSPSMKVKAPTGAHNYATDPKYVPQLNQTK